MTAAWTVKQLKADNDNVTEETTTGFAGLAPDGAEDYTAIAAKDGAMQEVAQGEQADNAQVPAGASSVSVHGSAGTSVSLAAPSLGSATLNGGIIYNPPKCTNHSLDSYYATDHLGTVRFVKTVDETGTEVATSTHDYEPFGVEITPTDACDNTHRFTGHERDTETGNDYMHFRFFSASMGRFQKPDSNFDNPTSNPQGWNLYSYAKGNPINFNDPTGHAASDPTHNTANVQGETTHTPEEEEEKQEALDKLRRQEAQQALADLMHGPGAHGLEAMSILAHDGFQGPGNTKSNLMYGAANGSIQVDDSQSVAFSWVPGTPEYSETTNGPSGSNVVVHAATPGHWERQEVMYASQPAPPRQESVSAVTPATFHFGRFLYLNSRHPTRVLALACTGFVVGAAASGPAAPAGAAYGTLTGVLVAEVTLVPGSWYSDSTGPPPEPDDPPPGLGRFSSQPTSEPIPPLGQPAGH